MNDIVAVEYSRGIENAFSNIATFVPKLLVALLILLVAFFVAKALQKIVNSLLERVGFDNVVERGGVKKAMDQTRYDASDILAKLVYYAVLLIGLSIAASVFGENPITDYINSIVAFLPKIFVAIIIVVVAAFIAGAVRDLVEGTLGGLSYGKFLANAAFAAILFLGVIAALNQIEVAQFVTQAVTTALLVALVGVIVVGVGGGLVRPMERRWDDLLDRGVRGELEGPRRGAAQPRLGDVGRLVVVGQLVVVRRGAAGDAARRGDRPPSVREPAGRRGLIRTC